MDVTFYLSAAVAVLATVLAITRPNAVHALIYLIVSLLAVALVLYTLGAPFVAALEVIIYAGAIMVLFVFVIMMLNLGAQAAEQEREWMHPTAWLGPALLALVLVAEVIAVLAGAGGAGVGAGVGARPVEPKQVGLALFGPYLLGVELASMLLLAGLLGASHLGRHGRQRDRKGGA
jgi:NADH-quinone oxidoreductase subunit J